MLLSKLRADAIDGFVQLLVGHADRRDLPSLRRVKHELVNLLGQPGQDALYGVS